MKGKSRLLANAVALLMFSIGGIIATAFKSVVEDNVTTVIGDSFQFAFAFMKSPELWKAVLVSIAIFLITALATLIAGLAAGWLMFSSHFASSVLEPMVQIMRPVPSIAMIAIGALILSPLSDYLAILVAFLGSLWPFTICVLEAFRQVPKTFLESTTTLGKSRGVYYRQVLFFAALPSLFSAIRLVAPITLLLTVTTQYFYPHLGGLGALLYERHSAMAYSDVICTIAVLSTLGIMVEGVVVWFENFVCRWKSEQPLEVYDQEEAKTHNSST